MAADKAPPRYPRDMGGHGPRPPDPDWPDGARIAVQIVVNYEEGGERNVLHGDPESEAFLSEIPGAEPWPGQRHLNMETIYEYGARAGFWRLHRTLGERGIRPTVFAVASALARGPEQAAAMVAAGWEVASHGLKWIEYSDMPEADEARHIAEAVRLHEAITGTRPPGFYQGRCSMNTLRLAARHGFDWLADSYADDLPYWARIEGRDQLVVPYTLDANDMRFSTAAGFGTSADFAAYLIDTFDQLYAEGGRMMSVGLHCRLAGRPGRARALARFVDHATALPGVWFATRGEIAAHWRARHPPAAAPRPSEMDRAAFLDRFGGVVEHSPWVAEGAYALELGLAHDRADGLAGAFARAFREGGEEARLTTLRAHPDLAGKLAQARRLTPESTAEQARAGLDALTDAERTEFETLNAAYAARFGFPFIIAVRDHDKAGILAAFRRRLSNDEGSERAEAERQVLRIARHRIAELLR